MSEGLSQRRKALEDQFFSQKDKALLDALRKQMGADDSRAELTKILGITNDAALDHIESLGFTSVTASVVSTIPMLAVAWADGEVDAKEREAILDAAHDHGIEPGTPADQMLADWLVNRPSDELFEAWKSYVSAISNELSAEEVAATKNASLERARKVARAAGGVLGLGNRISRVEQQVLDEMEQAFGK